MHPLHLLIAGNSASELEQIKTGLHGLPNARLSSLVIRGDWLTSLQSFSPTQDIMVFCLGDSPERDLMQLANWTATQRPTLLLVGSLEEGADQRHLMRLAMQAGARDFINRPVAVDTLQDEISRIRRERQGDTRESNAVTAMISPKGGAGAASLAGGVAHALVARYELPTLLLDLDYQFGAQYLNLDLHPEKGLKEAIEAIEGLDSLALAGYVTRHRSGLHVLGALPSQLLIPADVADPRLGRLMALLTQTYSQVVINLPCLIDPLFNLVAEHSSQILLVLQQDFQNIRNGQKLQHILKEELGVPADRINLIINRFERHNAITIEHIQQGLQMSPIAVIPSDFRLVSGAANLGIPILEHSPASPVAHALVELAGWISGDQAPPVPRTLWGELASIFKGN